MNALTPEDIFQILTTDQFGAYAINMEQTLLFWNPGAQRVLGLTPEETLGRPCHQITAASAAGLTPDCRPGCPALQNVRAGRTPPEFQTLMLSSSGLRIPVTVTALAIPDVLDQGLMLVYIFNNGLEQGQNGTLAEALLAAIYGDYPSGPDPDGAS